jgi:ribosomal protein RSM22 (predicted rRNA methylase)
MRLPEKIAEKILSCTDMDGLDHKTKSLHSRRLRGVREQMRRLSADFRADSPSEARYSDAYFLYNFPSNVVKTMHVMTEIKRHWPQFLLNRNRYSVLDVGCGDGAGMVGLYHSLKNGGDDVEFRFMGIDSSRIMLDRARKILHWHSKEDRMLRAKFFQRNAKEIRSAANNKKYDIILLINSLAEIVEEDILPTDFMGTLYGSLVEGGLLVIIEPALKSFARRLMHLRDGLVRHKAMQVLLPCLHNGPCSLLQVENRREWCHQSVVWSPPEYLQIINHGLNREIDVLKFAYLVAVKTKTPQSKKTGYRVVSQLLKEKGKVRCFICTPVGRVELVRLGKSKTAHNACFDLVNKGDVMTLDNVNIKKTNYWQVTEKTKVDLV